MTTAVLTAIIGFFAFGGIEASPVGAACAVSYPHPAKAALVQASLVQMFVSCNNPGGNTPNGTTETGTAQSCFPAETFHQQHGTPPEGWTWGPNAKGSISLKAGKNKLMGPPDYSQNTDPDAADLYVRVKMNDIRDHVGLATVPADFNTGPGVEASLRVTIIDRVASQPMTIVDFPVRFPTPVVHGKISTKTSLAAFLGRLGTPAFPACSTIELLSAWIVDPGGNRFAELGTYLP